MRRIAIGILALLFHLSRRQAREGSLFLAFLLVYGSGRTILETMRDDTPAILYGMAYPQLIGITMAAVGLALVAARRPVQQPSMATT